MEETIVTTSWDDGHLLDIKLAELLKKYNLPGTFYISPNNREFESTDLLTSDQIKALSKDFEIGAHTMTHPRLNKLPLEVAAREIKESKQYLEQVVGQPVDSFCYPGGDYNNTHIEQVKNAGFRCARTTQRFSFKREDNRWQMSTTVHAYNHWSDVGNILLFVKFNLFKFFRYYRRWDLLAMAMFDQVKNKGGIFHLWGHSWEIEKNHDWQRLENVFKYISSQPDIIYSASSRLIL